MSGPSDDSLHLHSVWKRQINKVDFVYFNIGKSGSENYTGEAPGKLNYSDETIKIKNLQLLGDENHSYLPPKYNKLIPNQIWHILN